MGPNRRKNAHTSFGVEAHHAAGKVRRHRRGADSRTASSIGGHASGCLYDSGDVAASGQGIFDALPDLARRPPFVVDSACGRDHSDDRCVDRATSRLGDSRLWLAYGAGLILTVIVSLVVSNFLPMLGLGKLERLVRSKFEKQGAPAEILKGMFVSLAPDGEPRIYENNWAWDVGFLLLSPDRLYYWGEEARFAIERDDVIRIWTGPGPFSWTKTAAAYISWTDRNGQSRTLNLRACSASSLSQMSRMTRLLARDLENWRSGLPAASDATTRTVPTGAGFEAEFSPPGFGAVTNMAGRDLARGRFLVRDLFINTFLAIGIAVLLACVFLRSIGWSRRQVRGPQNIWRKEPDGTFSLLFGLTGCSCFFHSGEVSLAKTRLSQHPLL